MPGQPGIPGEQPPYDPNQPGGFGGPGEMPGMPPQAGSSGKKPNILLLVGVILGVLVLIGGIVFVALQMMGQNFEVGGCVEQVDGEAVAISCDDVTEGEPGIYQITEEVTDQAECDDPTQPAVKIDDGELFYCLTPYGE